MRSDSLVNNSHENNTKDAKSDFDLSLQEKWKKAQEKGAFRYKLNIRDCKILDGKYRVFAQLNIDRGRNRRFPEDIRSMRQGFDENGFNFTKLKPEEEIMKLNSKHDEDLIAINASPIEFCHSLLLPQRCKKLPQIMTKYSLFKAVELFSSSSSRYFRACFNSLCAHASVNHLHWHIYYLNSPMLLEYIDLKEFAGPVQILDDYPAKAFCVKYSSVQNSDAFVNWAYLIVDYLQNAEIAHNVYVTRAQLDKTENCNDLRIYIWAREKASGIKHVDAFNPASCELFGHLSIKTQELYNDLTEELVAKIFQELTESTFYSVSKRIKTLIEEQMRV